MLSQEPTLTAHMTGITPQSSTSRLTREHMGLEEGPLQSGTQSSAILDNFTWELVGEEVS